MNQYLTIRQIRSKLQRVMQSVSDSDFIPKLEEIDHELERFLEKGIDFKEIADELDDSIFITDNQGNVLYVNPPYTRITGITPEKVLNHNVYDLIEKDRLYTGGAVPDVLQTKKSAFRLSTTYSTENPLTGCHRNSYF